MTDQPTKALAPYQQLKKLVTNDEVKARFEMLLKERAPQFLASLLNLAYLDDKLRECNPNSIITAAMTAAALDLPVSKELGFAWIIPYQGVAQFQMGYKGYIQLALRTGLYEVINATEIYEGEEIKVNRLTGEIVLNGRRTGDRVIGYASYMRMKNGYEHYVYMTVEEVTAHAERYSKAYQYDKSKGTKKSTWFTNFDAMAKKTVLKANISKYGVMSIQMQDATAADIDSAPDPRAIINNNPEDMEVIDATWTDAPIGDAELFAQAFVDNGISENEHAAANTIKHMPAEINTIEAAVSWGKLYRAWRDAGQTTTIATDKATAGEVPA